MAAILPRPGSGPIEFLYPTRDGTARRCTPRRGHWFCARQGLQMRGIGQQQLEATSEQVPDRR